MKTEETQGTDMQDFRDTVMPTIEEMPTMQSPTTPQSKTQEELVEDMKKRRGALEQDHLRLKELEISVLYEELNTRNLAAVKSRMQSFITITEIETKYNRLVEQDRAKNEKANRAEEQMMKMFEAQNSITSENLVSSDN